MKPVIILPPETMSPEDIAKLNDNGFCVVESKDPARVKFVDSIPDALSRTALEQGALKLSRIILAKGFWSNDATRQMLAAHLIDILVQGTPLDPYETRLEKAYDFEKEEALRCLARADAKAERDAKKALKLKETQTDKK